MRTLCFEGYYTQRFGRVKAFCEERAQVNIEQRFAEAFHFFCNRYLEHEFTAQSGAERYERTAGRRDRRNGHYFRQLVTARGTVRLSVPRGENQKYEYSLFEHYKRYTKEFDEIVLDALIKGHSTRNASKFFGRVFGEGTISHQAASSALRQCDEEIGRWKKRRIKNNAIVLVIDAVHLRGAMDLHKRATPVLFAYAVYKNGEEEVLGYELVRSESKNAYYRFAQKLYDRGLKNVELVVHDDTEAISEAVSFTWPQALDQQCVFHVLKNFGKKLKGLRDKKELRSDASELFKASSEGDFLKRARRFQQKWNKYSNHFAIKYLFKMIPDSIKYYQIPEQYWSIAKTSNRLERFFEELKRRIKPMRRFQNAKSCNRWLYALIREHKQRLGLRTSKKSQHNY